MAIDASVTVVGAYGTRNLGDDALMLVVLRLLREVFRPAETLVLTLHEAAYLEDWFPEIRFLAADRINTPVHSQLLVYGGGTQFYSFSAMGDGAWGSALALLRRAGRCLWHPRRLLNRLLIPEMTRVRFEHSAALGIGLGPFLPWSEQLARARLAMSACDVIQVRDQASLEWCLAWGLDKAVLATDLCYSSRAQDALGLVGVHAGSRETQSLMVVIRQWRSPESAYVLALRRAVVELRGRGIRVTYASLQPPYDHEIIRELTGQGEEVLLWEPDQRGVRAFVECLAEHSVVVSARAHGAILAAVLGVPSICVGLEPKLQLVAEQTGGGLWSPPFNAQDLVRMATAMMDGIDVSRRKSVTRVLELRATADLAEAAFLRFAGACGPAIRRHRDV